MHTCEYKIHIVLYMNNGIIGLLLALSFYLTVSFSEASNAVRLASPH